MTIAKIQRVSRIMSGMCLVGMVGLPLSLGFGWGYPDIVGSPIPGAAGLWGVTGDLPAATRMAGFLVSMIPAGVLIYGLDRLRHMFRLYGMGSIFTANAARCLRQFSATVMLQAVLSPLATAAHSIVVTLDNPPGERMLTLSLGNQEFTALLLGGLLLVIAWVMGEGAKLADENRQFV